MQVHHWSWAGVNGTDRACATMHAARPVSTAVLTIAVSWAGVGGRQAARRAAREMAPASRLTGSPLAPERAGPGELAGSGAEGRAGPEGVRTRPPELACSGAWS